MSDEALTVELINEIVGDLVQQGVFQDARWISYGLAAEVMDDGSTIQAAYVYDGDGVMSPSKGVKRSFSLVELRDASRDDDGTAWDTFVLKIHRDSGQAGLKFLRTGDPGYDQWSLDVTNDARLSELLRARQEDFEKPID